MSPFPISSPGPVRRLQVTWRKGKWSIESELHISSMTLMKSDALPPATASHARALTGFWYEAVDAQGEVLYRQSMADPFNGGVEIFDGNAIIRKPHKLPESISFDVLIPDQPAVTELHFFGSMEKGPAERMARLPVRRQGGSDGRK